MISEIETEMVRAKAVVTGAAVLAALALSNPTPQDYLQWNRAPAAWRLNLGIASLYDGDVIGLAGLFVRL